MSIVYEGPPITITFGIGGWILILIILIIILIFCPFFRLINRNQQLILKELSRQEKPIKRYGLIKKVKRLPQKTGYRNLDNLIADKIVSYDGRGRVYIEEDVKKHISF